VLIFCKECKIEKALASFYIRKSGTPHYPCKVCRKQTYENNREKYIKKTKDNYTKNKELILEYKKEYYKKNKKQIIAQKKIYEKKRRKEDVCFRLKKQLRTRLLMALASNAKTGSAVNDLGCSIEFLKTYLESKFQLGMSWDNHSIHGWHIDHIKPLASFNLTDRKELIKACHYTNLQPLWSDINWKKQNKIHGNY
jgi:hypothetical protein